MQRINLRDFLFTTIIAWREIFGTWRELSRHMQRQYWLMYKIKGNLEVIAELFFVSSQNQKQRKITQIQNQQTATHLSLPTDTVPLPLLAPLPPGTSTVRTVTGGGRRRNPSSVLRSEETPAGRVLACGRRRANDGLRRDNTRERR